MDNQSYVTRIFIFFLFILSISGIQAQPRNPVFERLSTSSGLSHTNVNCFLEDSKGFLWIGTANGLGRYDGYQFKNYFPSDTNPNTLSHNFVKCILEDSKGNLWIGTENGLNMYDRDNDSFIRYLSTADDLSTLSHNHVQVLFEDQEKNLWIGTRGGGLNRYDHEKDEFVRYPYIETGPTDLNYTLIHAIHQQPGSSGNTLWIATEKGFYQFSPLDNKWRIFSSNPNNARALHEHAIVSLHCSPSGKIYLGTWLTGLFVYNPATDQLDNYRHNPADPGSISHNIVLSIEEDTAGNIWLGTRGGGISLFNPTTNTFSKYLNRQENSLSLSDNNVNVLYFSSGNLLWAGTRFGGINKLNLSPKLFSVIRHNPERTGGFPSSRITALHRDAKGVLWVGTEDEGIFAWGNRNKIHHFHTSSKPALANNYVLSITTDKEGNVLVGTDGGGLSIIHPEKATSRNYLYDHGKNSISNNHVYSLLVDSHDRVWLGTWGARLGGLDMIDMKTGKFYNLTGEKGIVDLPAGNVVFSILEDKEGYLWVGTRGSGILRFHLDSIDLEQPSRTPYQLFVHHPDSIFSLGHNDVHTIVHDNAGVLWIGTGGGGLARYDKDLQQFVNYTEKHGLASNVIYAIISDQQNKLWISTPAGISSFDQELETFRNFKPGDGLPECAFSQGVAIKGNSGRILFGNMGGLVYFYPDSLVENSFAPKLAITGLYIYNERVSRDLFNGRAIIDKAIEQLPDVHLSYRDKYFTIEFASLDFTSPEKNQYKYMLEGFDKQWINTSANRRYASYTNLPAGTYIFVLRGTNSDGIWSPGESRLKIVVHPPFWGTLWFKIISSLIVLGMVSYLISSQFLRIIRQKKELEEETRFSQFNEKNRLRTLIDNMPDFIYIKDTQSRFIVANKYLANVIKVENPQNIEGKTDFDYYPKELAKDFYQDEQYLIKTGESLLNKEEKGLDMNGDEIEVLTTKIPLKNHTGEIIGLVGIGRDITKQKRAEQKLMQQTEELQEVNVILEERQEEIQQQSEELSVQAESLRYMNQQLQKLNRTKDKFFSIIAHDLKNPFNAILGLSFVLSDEFDNLEEEKKLEIVDMIKSSAENASGLLENLLQWSRSQMDNIKFRPEQLNITEIVEENIKLLQANASKKRIELKEELDEQLILTGDRNMLSTVFRNLISNAIKFTELGGKITIGHKTAEGNIHVSVQDNGIGMDQETMDKLFSVAETKPRSGTAGESGTGLGLVLCKEFIERHGGKLIIHSQPGVGTTFIVTLPQHPVEA